MKEWLVSLGPTLHLRLRSLVKTLRSWLPLFQVVGTLVAVYGAYLTAQSYLAASESFALNNRQYQEERYSRNQGAVSLAWQTISEANNHPYEVGQSSSILYLAQKGVLPGRLIFNGSAAIFFDGDVNLSTPNGGVYLWMPFSSICGTAFSIVSDNKFIVDLSNSLAMGAKFSGQFGLARFIGSDLTNAVFSHVEASDGQFIASNMEGVIIRGGTYINTDFQGADMRRVVTERGADGLYYGYETGYYDTLTPTPWQALFSSDVGVDEALISAGIQQAPDQGAQLVNFSNAHFLHTDLRGANLTKSNITQKQVKEACTDASTVLPAGVTSMGCADEPLVKEKREKFQRLNPSGPRVKELCEAAVPDAISHR
jgi:hypothetical protein